MDGSERCVAMLRWDAAQVAGPTVHPCPASSSTGPGSFNSLTSSQQSQPEQEIIELLSILIPRTSPTTSPSHQPSTPQRLPWPRSQCQPSNTIELWVRLRETQSDCQSKSISIPGAARPSLLLRKVYQDVDHYCWANILYLILQLDANSNQAWNSDVVYNHHIFTSVLCFDKHSPGRRYFDKWIYLHSLTSLTQSNIFHPADIKYFSVFEIDKYF